MNEENFELQDERLQVRLDKIVEAVKKGLLSELLMQEEFKRTERRNTPLSFTTSEMTKAYAYYWRQFGECTSLPLDKQMIAAFQLFYDISCRFDPPTFSEQAWDYNAELTSGLWDYAQGDTPPFSSITFQGEDSEYTLAQAKMLYLYGEVRDHLLFLLKMNINNKKTNDMKPKNSNKATKEKTPKQRFAEAVEQMEKETTPDLDILIPNDMDYDTYNYFDDMVPLDSPQEEEWVETYKIKDAERRVAELPFLHRDLEKYLNLASQILEKQTDDAKRYAALGRLYDLIEKENGGYIDDLSMPSTEEEIAVLAERWMLVPSIGKQSKIGILEGFLGRVKELIGFGTHVIKIGSHVDISDGWDWDPVKGIYPAQVILSYLEGSIRQEMRHLHLQVSIVTGEEIPKHQFVDRRACFDEEKCDVCIDRIYVTDDDRDKSSLPDWIMDESENDESASNKGNTAVTEPVSTKKRKGEITPAHIMMSDDYARYFYKGLRDKVEWLVEPQSETEFVNRLFANPPDEKIKLKQVNQIKYIARHYIFPKKSHTKGKRGENLKAEESHTIIQLFECDGGKVKNFAKAKKDPKNCEKLDAYMRGYREKKRKKQGE